MSQHPWFARTYLALTNGRDIPGLGVQRAALLEGLCGLVLEIGTGPGGTLGAYPPTVRAVVALEPEAGFHGAARMAAQRAPVPVCLVAGVGEALPLADASVDAVVSSLVLCSVQDLPGVVREIRRVLRPGGRLRFCEHVRSPRPTLARLQAGVGPVWSRVAGGCHLDRDTPAALEAGGLLLAWTRRVPFGPADALGHIAPLLLGEARRPPSTGAAD